MKNNLTFKIFSLLINVLKHSKLANLKSHFEKNCYKQFVNNKKKLMLKTLTSFFKKLHFKGRFFKALCIRSS